MPFLGVDSWRWQYFEHQAVPDNLVIPIDDATAWQIFPRQRWVYNKLLICESQGLPHGPHGTEPGDFPVFSKPIYNMRGMGIGGRMIESAHSYEHSLEPGHMWMPLLTGAHVSTDVALAAGRPRWWRHTTGHALGRGVFDFWTVHAEPRPELEAYLADWIARCLADFTGIVNFETIGGRIIECHLRMSEQWLDLNGPGWLPAVVQLYRDGIWEFRDDDRRIGYSVVLFGEHGVLYRIDRQRAAELVDGSTITSIQITFEDEKPAAAHAMPPGGFRLAIVNCRDLEAGRNARAALDAMFRSSASAPRKNRDRAADDDMARVSAE
jgi:hypothetical protein